MAPDTEGPWLFAAANAAPYVAVAVGAQLRRRPWWQRVLTAAVSLVLVGALAPVGSRERAQDGWLVYLVLFVGLGVLSWIALGFWWLARQFWAGRFGSKWPDNLFSTVGPRKKHSFPAVVAYLGFWIGSVPWLYPLSALPFAPVWTWIVIASWAAGFLLIVVLQISERPPKIFVPPYMRAANARPGQGDFLLVLSTATVLAAALSALTLWIIGLGVAPGWIKAAVFLAWAFIAVWGATRLRDQRTPNHLSGPGEPSARPPTL